MIKIFKYKILLFIILAGLTADFNLYAVPPHPDNTNPTGRERSPLADGRYMSMSSSLFSSPPVMMQSPVPEDGEMRMLVILADFGSSTASLPPMIIDNNFYDNKTHILLILIFAVFLLFLFKKHRKSFTLTSFMVILASCPSPDRINYGDPLFFKSSVSLYEQILGGDTGFTMKQYFSDMSNGHLNLSFDVAGPFRVSKGWQYYGRNDSNGYDMHPGEFVGEAVDLAKESGVDFSLYDNNNDGYVDGVIIVHAGPGEESGADPDTLWSHYFTLSAARTWGDGKGARTYDGKIIDKYTLQPEYNNYPGDSTIGVFCHELGHILGLPDLYDTSNKTFGVGLWSLMSSGSWGGPFNDGSKPAPLLAWERNRIGGSDWVTLNTAVPGSYSINDIEATNAVYKIPLNGMDGDQYLILEGKVQIANDSSWYVPASGILITHIHEGIISKYWNNYSNSVNAGLDRIHGVNIVEAANDYDISGRSYLWTKTGGNFSKMPFAAETRGYLDSTADFPNTYYYPPDQESITPKSGYSGARLFNISSRNTFPMSFSFEITE